jgi:hypothetical protein
VRACDARIVDQYVHPAEPIQRALDQSGACRRVDDVGRDHQSAIPELRCQRIERRPITPGEHDAGALLDETLRNRPTDAAAGAGDDRNLASEALHDQRPFQAGTRRSRKA